MIYDSGKIALQIFVGFGLNRKDIVKNSLRCVRIGLKILHESYESATN